tara:strand:- start:240 stop:557 length:318 start_codon:yes stop_codon:yes gene_type:complete
MRLKKTEMSWKNIEKKLRTGVAIADREQKVHQISNFNDELERIALQSAKSTGQLEGFGQEEGDLFESIKTGSIFPDMVAGFSTKTIFAVFVLALLFKVKSMQKDA